MNAVSSLAQIDRAEPVDGDDARLRGPEPEVVERLKRWVKAPNIALLTDENGEPDISEEELDRLGMTVVRGYGIDKNSRADWEAKTRDAMNLAMQIAETKQYPWPKASNVLYPVLTTAAVQFNARAYPAIIQGREVVKGVVVGPDDGVPMAPAGGFPLPQAAPGGQPQPPQTSGPQFAPGKDGIPQVPGLKQQRADRIGEHMSYQLLDEQEEWEPEMDKLLLVLPIVGCEFKKSYFDSAQKMNVSVRVPAMSLVVNYKAKSIERAPRLTEIVEHYPNEIKEMENSGTFRTIDYATSYSQDGDDDAPVAFLEQHRWWDFDDDGMKEPYIVTVEEKTQKVVRVVARYDVDSISYNFSKGRIQKIEPVHYYTKYGFLPNPDGGIYDIGFGQLLKPLNEAINTSLNMLIDSGHLANVQGGFVGKGLSMNAGSLRFQPGEWKSVNVAGAMVRDSIVPLKFDGPSPVLFQLLGMLVDAAKEVAGVKDVLTGETLPANTPATTMLAMIEQGLKTYTAIYKRVHRALKQELAKLYRLNRLYLNDQASYRMGDVWKSIKREDYAKGAGVEPVSDPTVVTDMQKLGQAQFLAQFRDDPMMNGMEIRKRELKAANIPNADMLFNPNPQPNPAVMAKMAELSLKGQELQLKSETAARLQATRESELQLRERHDAALIEKEQASAVESRSRGVLNLAQADVAVGMMNVAALQHQLDAIKAQMDAIADARLADTQAAVDPVTTQPGTPEARQQGQAPQPGAGTPPAPQQPAMPAAPPIPGARMAPDGNHYLQHPETGQYFRVDPKAPAA